MTKVFFRTGFNYDVDAVSNETALSEFDPTMTQQNQRDDADINVMLKRFNATGIINVDQSVVQYLDCTTIAADFHAAMNLISDAHASFDSLPAEARAFFNNDASVMIEWLSDSANKDKAIELGLIDSHKEQVPISVRVIADSIDDKTKT